MARSSIAGAKVDEAYKNLSRAWILARARRGLDDVRLHDLRHSFASLALRHGKPLATIGKLLGHRAPQTTARYAHLARDVAAEANDTIGAAMMAAIERVPSPAAEVVKLPRRRRP